MRDTLTVSSPAATADRNSHSPSASKSSTRAAASPMTPVAARRAAPPVAVAAACLHLVPASRVPASTTRPPAPTVADQPPCRSSHAKTARSIAATASSCTVPPAPADAAATAAAAAVTAADAIHAVVAAIATPVVADAIHAVVDATAGKRVPTDTMRKRAITPVVLFVLIVFANRPPYYICLLAA